MKFKVDNKVNANKIIEKNIKKVVAKTEKKKENQLINKLLNTTEKKTGEEKSNLKKIDLKIVNSPSATSNFTEIRKNLFSPSNASKLLSPSPSLKPFPVVNNEFYNEAKNTILWQGETEKIKAEKTLSRNNTERKYLRNNMFIFNKVNILLICLFIFQ